MKQWIIILIMLTFFSNLSLFAKEKERPVCGVEKRDVVLELHQFNRIEKLGLSTEDFNTLPKSIKRRIPDHLTKTDSLLITTDFQSAIANDNRLTAFSNGDFNGNIIKSGRNTYQVLDNQNNLLGVFCKSNDGKHYTLLNKKGYLLSNTQSIFELAVSIILLLSLLFSLLIIVIIYAIVSGN